MWLSFNSSNPILKGGRITFRSQTNQNDSGYPDATLKCFLTIGSHCNPLKSVRVKSGSHCNLYEVVQSSGDQCLLGIQEMESGPQGPDWILGDASKREYS